MSGDLHLPPSIISFTGMIKLTALLKCNSSSFGNKPDDMILYIENPKRLQKTTRAHQLDSVKLQDTKLIHKNLLHFYTITTKDQEREELRKQSHLYPT